MESISLYLEQAPFPGWFVGHFLTAHSN